MGKVYFDPSRACDKFSSSAPPAFPFRVGFKTTPIFVPGSKDNDPGFIASHIDDSFYSSRNHMKGGDKRIGYLTEEEAVYRSFIQERLLNLANEKVKNERRIVMKRFWNFVKDENGLETVEYAIIAGLITVASIVIIGSIGQKVADVFNVLLGELNTIDTGGAAS